MAAWSPAAAAQGAPVVSRPVVQALPSADSKRLNAALATIGRNPRDVPALIEAGDAARAMQDYAAAIGFYRRADEASPGNARVKAGMGSAFVLSGDPVSAIPLFDEAEKAGATPGLISGDRGLAYDLVGDNASAQRQYAMALPATSGAVADEVRTRLAVSQAIGGDGDTAYRTLLPLLNKQDKPGWRTRAFTLAIKGDTNEAVDVAQKILPAPLAQNIAPYLRYMPRLTRAQQAAAANLGRFPRASEVGRDDARIAAYAPPRTGAAGGSLIPKGEPLGTGGVKTGTKVAAAAVPKPGRAARAVGPRTRGARDETGRTAATVSRPVTLAAADPDRVAPPEVNPTIERDGGELPALGRKVEMPSTVETPRPTLAPNPGLAQAPTPVPVRVAQATPAPVRAPVTQPSATQPTSPGFDLAQVPASQSALAPQPAPQSPPPASTPPAAASTPPTAASTAPSPGPGQLSLADIFADLGKPTAAVLPAPGAVDIRMITPAAPPPRVPPKIELPQVDEADAAEPKAKDAKAKLDPKAKDAKTKAAEAKAAEAKAVAEAKAKARKSAPPSHPSRIWVQIGVGRDKAAIAFDWRRNNREAPALFKGRQPYVSEMGRTNRILIGPFATQKAATAFIADARKQGISDALPWTSPAGQVVDALSGK